MIFVYVIRSNGLEYVGVTSNIKRRTSDHLKADSHVGRCMRAHGFQLDILETHSSHEEAFESERKIISSRNTRHPHGMNSSDGGEGVVNPTQEVRDKLSRAMKRRYEQNDETLYRLKGAPLLSKDQEFKRREASRQRMIRLNADPAFREASRQRMIDRMKSRHPLSQ